jgi:hypothetical protein
MDASYDDVLAAGPVHRLVVEFDLSRFRGEILPELERLKELGVIRVVDLLAVRKDRSGALSVLTASDLTPEEASEFGATVGGLIGLGAGGRAGAAEGAIVGAEAAADGHLFDPAEAREIAARIPSGSTVVVALLEHRWAVPLRNAIARAGGVVVDEQWIGAEDLIALGLRAAAQAEQADGPDASLEAP